MTTRVAAIYPEIVVIVVSAPSRTRPESSRSDAGRPPTRATGLLSIPAPRAPIDADSRLVPSVAPRKSAPVRRNRIWTVAGHAGTVVTLAATLTICASLAARIDGAGGPPHPPSPVSGLGAPAAR